MASSAVSCGIRCTSAKAAVISVPAALVTAILRLPSYKASRGFPQEGFRIPAENRPCGRSRPAGISKHYLHLARSCSHFSSTYCWALSSIHSLPGWKQCLNRPWRRI